MEKPYLCYYSSFLCNRDTAFNVNRLTNYANCLIDEFFLRIKKEIFVPKAKNWTKTLAKMNSHTKGNLKEIITSFFECDTIMFLMANTNKESNCVIVTCGILNMIFVVLISIYLSNIIFLALSLNKKKAEITINMSSTHTSLDKIKPKTCTDVDSHMHSLFG